MGKHLITSGCSFSDNCTYDGGRWPHYLAELSNSELHNYGTGSAGNHWISSSVIYGAHTLMNKGVDPSDIVIGVMWSYFNRFSLHISKPETGQYNDLLNTGQTPNPVNFINHIVNQEKQNIDEYESGWLLGSHSCSFENENINKFKQRTLSFITIEATVYEDVMCWLQLQWFCKANGIALFNMTIDNIWMFPSSRHFQDGRTPQIFYKTYPTTKHLYEMIDFDQWLIHGEHGGMYEYVRDNELEFYPDNWHPWPTAHKTFVKDFIWPKVNSLF